jgi:ABC-type antimicrobial peptide transport system permease subunit
MLKSYFKIAIRNLFKNKIYSFVNIVGLAIGMAACILILLWVTDEVNYNSFNKYLDEIYLIPQTQHYQTIGDFTVANTPLGLAGVLKQEYPEITSIARYAPYMGNALITYGDKSFSESSTFVDPSFLKMFSYKLVEGDVNTVLNDPHSILLTEELAKKYFGDEDPVGKILRIDNKVDVKVTGVIENVPANSDLKFTFLCPINLLKDFGVDINAWGNNNLFTYVILKNSANYKVFSAKIKDRLRTQYGDPTAGKLFLFPMKDFHLHSITGSGGRIKDVMIFSIIALFILIIACINFMNLATARSSKRATEVGIKKVVGATRAQIARQFFGESILLTFISLAFALLLVEILLPFFNDISQKHLVLSGLPFFTIILIIGTTVLTGTLAGLYPAFILSSFKPVKVLKGTSNSIQTKFSMRKVLVVLQFAISITLIIGTAVVYLQLNYMQDKDLGLDKNNVIYFPLDDALTNNLENVKTSLTGNPNILSASAASNLPFAVYTNGGGWKWKDMDPQRDELVSMLFGDNDLLKTFGIKLKEGRYYSKEFPADDSLSLVINESFEKIMGVKSAVGQKIDRGDIHWTVIGVVKDFNFTRLNNKIGPLVIFPGNNFHYLFIKVKNTDLPESIAFIKTVCKKIDPNYSFDYHFVDKAYEESFKSETRMGKIINSFAVLAIIISCLGLFGLASYIAELKTREIGIRKVLGASVTGIVYDLSKEFIKWVLISNLIAWPLAYYFMNNWLQDYAFRISFPFWILFAAAVLAIIIALITVSTQAFRAANSDPIKSLRYE